MNQPWMGPMDRLGQKEIFTLRIKPDSYNASGIGRDFNGPNNA
jgi:hypothetical protein